MFVAHRHGISRLGIPAVAAAALCAAAFVTPDDLGGNPGTVDTAARSFVQVTAREYSLSLSRTRIKPGPATFELVNFGEDDHDLAVSRKGSSRSVKTDVARPGERARVSLRVRRGTYVLWCTISDHRERGMRATLRVRR